MRRVLVCGSTSLLGRAVVRQCVRRGWSVRGFGRSRARLLELGADLDETHEGDALVPETLLGCCDEVDTVFSCVGASPRLSLSASRQPFSAVDAQANGNLLDEACRADVRRFVYVSTMYTAATRTLPFVAAHEAVVDRLRHCGLEWAVVRPTALFSLMTTMVDLALAGVVPLFGDGAARTNPVDDEDVAVACAEAMAGGPAEVEVGGPEIFTRREIAHLAASVIDRPARLVRLPAWVGHATASLALPINPRYAQLLRFAVDVQLDDLIAPLCGQRRLYDAFAGYAAERYARASRRSQAQKATTSGRRERLSGDAT